MNKLQLQGLEFKEKAWSNRPVLPASETAVVPSEEIQKSKLAKS